MFISMLWREEVCVQSVNRKVANVHFADGLGDNVGGESELLSRRAGGLRLELDTNARPCPPHASQRRPVTSRPASE